MVRRFWTLSLAISAVLGLAVGPATAQQAGGILKFFHRDSPASMSIHEEATISTVAPMMGVFNNLVLFQTGREAESAGIHPAGTSRKLVVGRGQHQAHFQAAAR